MILLLLFAATSGLLAGETLSPPEQERFLLSARILRLRNASKGITLSQRATLSNGTVTHEAHVQAINMVRPDFHDSYRGNIAAYRLGRLLHLDMIPVSVERLVEKKHSAVTWWIDDVLMDESARRKDKIEPPDRRAWSDQYHVVRVFDALIDNPDRNLGNLIIDRHWKLWMIDHTRAFGNKRILRGTEHLVRCERGLFDRLRKIKRAELQSVLGSSLSGEDIMALLARRDLIVRHFEQLIAARGQQNVLFNRSEMR